MMKIDEIKHTAWLEINSAPTDGTEVIGWIPLEGYVLMRFCNGWEFYTCIPSHKESELSTMGWVKFENPTYWRNKQKNPREWIY